MYETYKAPTNPLSSSSTHRLTLSSILTFENSVLLTISTLLWLSVVSLCSPSAASHTTWKSFLCVSVSICAFLHTHASTRLLGCTLVYRSAEGLSVGLKLGI